MCCFNENNTFKNKLQYVYIQLYKNKIINKNLMNKSALCKTLTTMNLKIQQTLTSRTSDVVKRSEVMEAQLSEAVAN